MIATSPKISTIVHALDLVVAAYKAKLPDVSLGVCEKIARTEGATLADVQRAVARGLQVLALTFVFGCVSRQADAAPAVPQGSDTVYVVPSTLKIPGRLLGIRDGVETWSLGDFDVRVRRVAP